MTSSGKTCIVTGANSGIGKQIALNLAALKARVVLACRSRSRGQVAHDDIRSMTGNDDIHLMFLDVSSQASIREFVQQFHSMFGQLHVLVNNAGIYPARLEVSVDDIELTWATNVMSYFMLSDLLLDALKAGAPSRIVNVASTRAGGLDLDDLQFDKRNFNGILAYRQSKQAIRMLSWELAERIEVTGVTVTVNVASPGPCATNITRYQHGAWGMLVKLAFKLAGKPPQVAADTATWLATEPQLECITGKLWGNRRELPRKFYDKAKQKVLWNRCEALIGVRSSTLARDYLTH